MIYNILFITTHYNDYIFLFTIYYHLLQVLLHHLLQFAIGKIYYHLFHLLQMVFSFSTIYSIYSIITGATCSCISIWPPLALQD